MNVLYCIDYNGEVDDGWSVRWWWVDPIVDVTSHTSVTFPKSWWKLRSPPAVDQMEKYQTGNFPKSQIHQIQIQQKWTKSNFASKAKTTTLDLCPQFFKCKSATTSPWWNFRATVRNNGGTSNHKDWISNQVFRNPTNNGSSWPYIAVGPQ